MGKSIVKGVYTNTNTKKEFSVSNIQLAILLLFNSKNKYTLAEISALLEIPFDSYKVYYDFLVHSLLWLNIFEVAHHSSSVIEDFNKWEYDRFWIQRVIHL